MNEVALHGFVWSLVRFANCHGCPEASGVGNLTRYCVTQFAWWCIVLNFNDIIEMILCDWRNTAAGPSENLKRLVSVVVVHCKYTIIHTIMYHNPTTRASANATRKENITLLLFLSPMPTKRFSVVMLPKVDVAEKATCLPW